MLAHFSMVRKMLRFPKTTQPDRTPDLPAVDAVLPCTSSPADRAIAIVDYCLERNAAARRAHA